MEFGRWDIWIDNYEFQVVTLENEFDNNEAQLIHFEIDFATCETRIATFAVRIAKVKVQFALFYYKFFVVGSLYACSNIQSAIFTRTPV